LAPYRGPLWRVIEGQYRSSTLRLVDTFAEHDALEAMLEAAKPPVPDECRHLDYQFWSPFRYGCYPRASRFRRAGRTPGVWYGSERPLTAICETIWGSLRFFAASPGTPLPHQPVDHTAVQARIATPFALDLTGAAMAGQGRWSDPEDYADCLTLADDLRASGGEAIRYGSVREPGGAANVAVMTCAAFEQPRPTRAVRWHIHYGPTLIRVWSDTTRATFAVAGTRLARAADPV
jgi:hypothetical protein